MLTTRVYNILEKNKHPKESYTSYHSIIFVPDGYIPYRNITCETSSPSVLSIYGPEVKIDSDHYYSLLLGVNTINTDIGRWTIEYVSEKENSIISVGISKDVLTQEIERLIKEGYTCYASEGTIRTFPEYKLVLV